MKYEAPELNELALAVNAIQGGSKTQPPTTDSHTNEASQAYEDWE